jgi:hypothetical protein
VSGSFTVTVSDPDNDLALTNVPASITTQATGPSGATVTFTPPTASDEDGIVMVHCDHPSGSTFPVGTTKVTCSATDTDDTPTTVSGSFTVTVGAKASGAAELLDQLEAVVQSGWQGKNLFRTVERAESDLAAGKVPAACRALESFVSEVKVEHDKSMTPSKRAWFIATAQQVENELSCPKPGNHRGTSPKPGDGKDVCTPATAATCQSNGAGPGSPKDE